MNVDSVVARLRRRKLYGAYSVATETSLLCRQVVSTYRWNHIDQLLQHLKDLGKRLTEAQPREFTSGNIVRRVLKMVREVYADSLASLTEDGEEDLHGRSASPTSGVHGSSQSFQIDPSTSIHSAMLNLLGRPDTVTAASSQSKVAPGAIESGNNLRPAIIAGIQDIMDELTRVYKDIGPHSMQHIHSSEIILTHGSSKTVASFLKQAAESRRFTVIIAESYPNDIAESHQMAETLSQAGITTILIPDSAVFGIMSRVNKVIMGTHAVLQNGGLLAASGAKQVALAARDHSTPVVIVTGVYKLTPFYPYDHENLIELISPERVSAFKEVVQETENVDILNPFYDYVYPELIALYITNLGAHAPTTLHRTMAENYDSQDYNF
ncbi:Translation initiation factor eIF-2B subunit beta [Taphrina deformans PYCC 5710]|uniref:Translation initiation factor eIF2B subunit beta n=1 Tax=Taphrina deformans (strain PYCC 5710 / ATCC 11124 / CBS 356.35 / IMI 108563 / JCM 9778 / NBRC 8474) TaxID=1097556 RepID=R4XCH2_TAPDE|nr:Translation initiation factor eIF-2B subunit beta [Taphrina deformans PYCC 5710]|eukprot:CCG83521.1 Translation initiation factor eIF-2B subunit beta [Taphrina deformans PYCC 5710]